MGYQLQYAQAGSASFTVVNVTGTSHTITNLLPNTAYVFQVRTLCGGSSSPVYSAWTPLVTFLTTGPSNACGVPTGLTATGVSQQGALLGWNAVTGAISYNIQYHPVNINVWSATTSNTNSKQIGSLTPGTLESTALWSPAPGRHLNCSIRRCCWPFIRILPMGRYS
jgi:hypothetical protein